MSDIGDESIKDLSNKIAAGTLFTREASAGPAICNSSTICKDAINGLDCNCARIARTSAGPDPVDTNLQNCEHFIPWMYCAKCDKPQNSGTDPVGTETNPTISRQGPISMWKTAKEIAEQEQADKAAEVVAEVDNKQQARDSLMLRFNHTLNCWQCWNYLSNGRQYPRSWRWFSITPEQAKLYAMARVPVSVEETVA